ncbi:DsbE family thiol:disulfide interchange protein [Phenylobacterium sp.]|uniref:DsbE family thiol:disulfide interchange protein n=1 Tax=Phenylobacterium sp. TaxID=1871053 RepID=UPI001204BB6D|nr:DsbE family thiol:disulfide interchange protein [Phenylobacterium sp.]THD50962.1 MAG: DsbE family thiol:disulfide interchange protein [Phenylobacterium sp.]
MSRWIAALPLVVLALLAALFAGYGLHHNPQVVPEALVGKQAPDVSLPSLDDGTLTSVREAAREGPILVNFFASWCGPCEIEHPVLMQLRASHVRIIGVAYKDAPENTKAFLTRLGDPFMERLVDRDGRAGIDFGVSGVPETYLVMPDGKVAAKYTNLNARDAQALTARMLTGR